MKLKCNFLSNFDDTRIYKLYAVTILTWDLTELVGGTTCNVVGLYVQVTLFESRLHPGCPD
jgi:hypothetical protein